MEDWEFNELTRQVVRQLLPRLPERYVDVFESMQAGGEYAYAVEELMHTVVDEQVPVSSAELEQLRVLAGDLTQSEKYLAKLEQVQPS